MGQQGTVAAPRANEPKRHQLPLGNRDEFCFEDLLMSSQLVIAWLGVGGD